MIYKEEIMKVVAADIVDNDHGSASLLIEFRAPGCGQGWVLPQRVTMKDIYKILVCFNANKLRDTINKPIIVIRNESETIIGVKRLPCDEPYEVLI